MPELLTNLKITGMEKSDGSSPSLVFEVMFNPNSYTVNHKLNFDTKQAPGNGGGEPEFKNKESETFTLEFMMDATGASRPAKPIIDQVSQFNKVTTNMNGKTHRPNYLVVQWGTFIRECVLQSANITYTLFSLEGIPLRAKVNATFIERADSELNARASMFSSPDLTHEIVVKEGDLLPLLTYKTYHDQKYYLQVARINKIKNFRKLIPGTRILFPPLS
jgi:hypothetical protein